MVTAKKVIRQRGFHLPSTKAAAKKAAAKKATKKVSAKKAASIRRRTV